MWKSKTRFFAILSAFLILIAGSGLCSAAIVHSGESIQAAVNNASEGDTILVESGIYSEDVTISKSYVTIKSQSGNPDDTIIHGLMSVDDAYTESTNGAAFDGLTLSGDNPGMGIFASGFTGVTAKNCKIMYYDIGMSAHTGATIVAENTQFIKCGTGMAGVYLSGVSAKNCQFIDCDTISLTEDGFYSKNNVEIHTDSSGNKITTPIPDYPASEIVVHNGESIQAAIDTVGVDSVIIIEPGIYNQNFTIDTNTITIQSSTGNPDDVIIHGKNEYGHVARLLEENITVKGITFKRDHADGYTISNPSTASTFENCKFINGGISCGSHQGVLLNYNTFINCEIAIWLDEQDFLSGKDNIFIDCGKIAGYHEHEMLTVDLENSTEINTSKQPTPTPTSTKTPTETPAPIPTENSGSSSGGSSGGSSHSSSGGGGTGGSPEDQKNVASKDTTKVFVPNGKQVFFNFTNDVTVVESISFTSKKTMGKITAITEDLKNKSSLVSELPEGEIYKSFNIWVGNAGYGESDNIQNATIDFKVEKSWLDEKNVGPRFIVLYKYDDKQKEWIEISTVITDEDNQYVYFKADVPGYSSFIIAGKGSAQLSKGSDEEPISGEVRSTGNGTVTKEIAKESPGFGLISGIVCSVFAIFYRRR